MIYLQTARTSQAGLHISRRNLSFKRGRKECRNAAVPSIRQFSLFPTRLSVRASARQPAYRPPSGLLRDRLSPDPARSTHTRRSLPGVPVGKGGGNKRASRRLNALGSGLRPKTWRHWRIPIPSASRASRSPAERWICPTGRSAALKFCKLFTLTPTGHCVPSARPSPDVRLRARTKGVLQAEWFMRQRISFFHGWAIMPLSFLVVL